MLLSVLDSAWEHAFASVWKWIEAELRRWLCDRFWLLIVVAASVTTDSFEYVLQHVKSYLLFVLQAIESTQFYWSEQWRAGAHRCMAKPNWELAVAEHDHTIDSWGVCTTTYGQSPPLRTLDHAMRGGNLQRYGMCPAQQCSPCQLLWRYKHHFLDYFVSSQCRWGNLTSEQKKAETCTAVNQPGSWLDPVWPTSWIYFSHRILLRRGISICYGSRDVCEPSGLVNTTSMQSLHRGVESCQQIRWDNMLGSHSFGYMCGHVPLLPSWQTTAYEILQAPFNHPTQFADGTSMDVSPITSQAIRICGPSVLLLLLSLIAGCCSLLG